MKTKLLIRRISLTFLALILFQSAYCQENYLAGYIIKTSGDSLHGFIDYRNWEWNPDKISFKETLSAEKVEYTPKDISLFSVLDEIYESAVIETEVSPNNTGELQYNSNLMLKTSTAFVQAMVKGSKSLYYYRKKIGKDQFYIKHDFGFELLKYKRYLKQINGSPMIIENKKYLGQLALYLSDCPIIQSKLKYTEYNKATLEKLFQVYYNYVHSDIKFQKKTENIKPEYGIVAGLTTTSLQLSSTSTAFSYLVDTKLSRSLDFGAGLFVNCVLPRNGGKLSIYNELNYSSYSVNGRFNDYDSLASANKFTVSHTTLGYSYLKMINMLRYKYPIGRSSVFFNVGFANGFAISETNYLKQDTKFYETHSVTESKAITATRKYEQEVVFGLGALSKKFSFEIRCEIGNGMSYTETIRSTTTRYSFMLGYRF